MLIKKSKFVLIVCTVLCMSALLTFTGCGGAGEKKTEETTVAPAANDTPAAAPHDMDTTGSGDTGLPRGTKNPN